MKITDVVVFEVFATRADEAPRPYTRQALQMDIYPGWEQSRSAAPASNPREIRALYLEIQTDEGVSGLFGSIEPAQAFLIIHELRSFLLGRDPLATELLLDQMVRLNRHGRSGMYMTAVSPVDCALWDLKGKAWNQPIYRLLGGPTRPAIPAYASMLGYSIKPEEAAQTAREFKEQGYQAQK